MIPKAVAPIVVAALALAGAGCGTDNDQARQYNAPAHTTEEVMRATSLTTNDGGLSYQTPNGCEVSAVLTSKQTVDMYVKAGSSVVATPDGSAGVELHTDTPACRSEIAKGLKSL